jgi:hypothetical protein
MARKARPSDVTDEDFLRRWSRRKLESGVDELDGEEPPPMPEFEEAEASMADPEAPAEVPQKTDVDMPPLESIGDDSSVSDFFSPGVSEALRKAALRKLFHLPKFNVVDGLNDYDDDFRFFTALGDIVTADMRHRTELEAEPAGAEGDAETAADAESAEPAGAGSAPAEDVEQTAGKGAMEAGETRDVQGGEESTAESANDGGTGKS